METSSKFTIVLNAETAQALLKFQQLITGIADGARQLAGIAAAGLGLHGIAHIADEVLKLGSALENLKNRTGGAIVDLVVLRRLLTETGHSADEAGVLLSRMQRNIADTAQDGGKIEQVFKGLNLSIRDLSKQNATEQFKAIGKAISEIENPARRAQVAMEIFGRTGGNLAAMFASTEKFAAAFAKESAFGQVMARNAELFHEIEVNMMRMAANGKKFVAGMLDEIAPLLEHAFDAMGKIDLTGVGQRAGALVAVIVQAAKDGKLPEMIGLLIEAGFEIGADAVKKGWLGLIKALQSLTSAEAGGIFTGLLNGIMTFGVQSAKFIIEILKAPITFVGGAFHYFSEQLRVMFENLGNFLKSIFADAINFFVDQFNAKLGGKLGFSIDRVEKQSAPVKPADSFDDSLTFATEAADEAVGNVKRFLDESLQASREILTVTGQITNGDNTQATAKQRLVDLIEAQLAKTKELRKAGEPGESPAIEPGEGRGRGLTESIERDAAGAQGGTEGKLAVLALDEEARKRDVDEQITDFEEIERLKLLITQTYAEKRKQVEIEEGKKIMLDRAHQQAAEARLRQTQLTATADMFGNMAAAAKAFGRSGFIAYKAFAIGKATIDTAQAAIGAYQSVVSIPYVGPFLAPIAAAAAAAAGAAQIATIAAQNFAVGGFTGGTANQPAGVVHGQEFVLSAPATERLGVANLDLMNQTGRFPTTGSAGHSPSASPTQNLIFLEDHSKLINVLRTTEGENAVIDMVNKNWHRLG